MTDPDDPLELAADRLGPPDAAFHVSPGRFAAKLAVGVGLLLYGVVANYVWWVHGPARFDHFVLLILFAPPASGVSLLWHVVRTRGLHVLVYPTGLLKVHAGVVESFPWAEVAEVSVRTDAATVEIERDESGDIRACWLAVEPPLFQIWKAGLTLRRSDGTDVSLTPALADYAGLAERVQRATFAELWPAARARFLAGDAVRFGDFAASAGGLAFADKVIPWADIKAVATSQKMLSVTRTGGWVPWAVKDLHAVPNPHVLLALVALARPAATDPA